MLTSSVLSHQLSIYTHPSTSSFGLLFSLLSFSFIKQAYLSTCPIGTKGYYYGTTPVQAFEMGGSIVYGWSANGWSFSQCSSACMGSGSSIFNTAVAYANMYDTLDTSGDWSCNCYKSLPNIYPGSSSLCASAAVRYSCGLGSYPCPFSFNVLGGHLAVNIDLQLQPSNLITFSYACGFFCFNTPTCATAVYNSTGCYFSTAFSPSTVTNSNYDTYIVTSNCVATTLTFFNPQNNASQNSIFTFQPAGACSIMTAPVGCTAWWSVDMTQLRHVLFVNITNPNTAGYKLPPINVGVASLAPSPTQSSPNICSIPNNYSLCGNISNYTPAGNIVTVTCKQNIMVGQYLIIQGTAINASLPLCEINIYVAVSMKTQWNATNNARLVNTAQTTTETVITGGECKRLCENSPFVLPAGAAPVNCNSFNYQPITQTCQLNTHSGQDSLVNDPSWQWYQPTYLLNI